MHATRPLVTVFCLALILCFIGQRLLAQDANCFTLDDYYTVEKIDIHAHIHCESTDFVSLSRQDNFRFVNMAVWSNTPEVNREKHRTTYWQYRANPDRIAPVCSFPIENWDEPDFVEKTIQYIDENIAKGAVGVKIWKNLGMVLRDADGNLVMIDNPKFDPIFAHIQKKNIVLLGHLGEPKNCWLPLDQMTVNNDRSYFSQHPKYHMYKHPDMPSYEDQIDARDNMLARHPGIRFIGCHLASLEWSVDEIAAFLDRFPSAVVGVAARMGQVQYQSHRDRERVRSFFMKYQDRLLYGTDTGVGPDSNAASKHEQVHAKWLRDWKYFNTSEQVTVPELDDPVQGIALPKGVVEKLYRINSQRMFNASWQNVERSNTTAPSSDLNSLSWLSGSWTMTKNGRTTEETWLAPKGSLMVGVNRTSSKAKASFEYMRIDQQDGKITLWASPGGREATPFRLTRSSHQTAIFENDKNDFPQRIFYQKQGSRLVGRIEGTINGSFRSIVWDWKKASSDGQPSH